MNRLPLPPAAALSLVAVFMFGKAAKAEQILMLGDSQTCAAFGAQIFKHLEDGGKNNVTQYCMEGTSPVNWLRGVPGNKGCEIRTTKNPTLKFCSVKAPTFDSILAQFPDAHVVMAFGTNSTPEHGIRGDYKIMAGKIKAAGHSCDWILPPHMNPQQTQGWKPGHVALMERNLPHIITDIEAAVHDPCKPIDSLQPTAPGTAGFATRDGVHRTDSAGKYWADEIKPHLTIGAASSRKASRDVFVNEDGLPIDHNSAPAKPPVRSGVTQ